MSSLATSIVIAVWVSTVQAKNETLIHGWKPEPDGRGTWSILWSCLATILICTWSALHLDVPKHRSRWYLLFRKLAFMLVAAAVPEYTLYEAAENFFESRDLLKNLVERGSQEWTLTHMQFARAGGFITRKEEVISKCSLKDLWKIIKNKNLDGPSISEEELQARGKIDLVVKLIAVLQILWFVVQTLFRAIQHYQITALEIMTVAFVFCSVFVYGFNLNRPQDVVYPVILDLRTLTPETDTTTQEQNLDKSNHAKENADRPISQPECVQSSLPSVYVPGRAAKDFANLLLILFACVFGALHCLAWNSSFATSKERLAWRICSVSTTALPALFTLVSYTEDRIFENTDLANFFSSCYIFFLVLYMIGRITLIVLAFTTLRALLPDAFQTVVWTEYFPHFAA